MSKYLRDIKMTIEFDGDKIVLTLKPMKLSDVIALRSNVEKGEIEVLLDYAKVLPAYISELSGIKDADGNSIGVEAFEDAYWMPVLTQVMQKHLEAVSPQDPTQPGAQ